MPVTARSGKRFASVFMLNGGVSIQDVSRMLGHESTRVTETYHAPLVE